MKTNITNQGHILKFLSILGALSIITLSGCTTLPASTKPVTGQSMPDTDVYLNPGDVVEVQFFYTPELNDIQTIRPDGKIALQLVGDVTAGGRTPTQLQAALQDQYTGVIEKPDVTVVVRELNNRSIYIDGAVRKPGMMMMPGNLTLLSAIIQAGGFDQGTAAVENVIVIRNIDGKRVTYCLNLRDAIIGASPHDPFYLHGQDIVYVPRTRIVDMGQWIDQHINQIVPQFGFTYYHTRGNSTIGLDTSSSR
ncbi:MAG: polysaccharide export protein [Spartobacteria bacterium]|nr:polysaccharide export protein [Spartobacteria bacterium]